MERGGYYKSHREQVESPEQRRTRLEDERIRSTILDPEASADLFNADPIAWLKGAIGVDTERGASEVSDRELMGRYVEGGRFEWDPLVAKRVASYLKSKGFHWTP